MMFPKPTKKTKNKKAAYNKAKLEYLNNNQTCEACFEKEATDIHHSAGRVGDLLTDPRYFFALCRDCHDHIHKNPKWAYEKGFLLERNTNQPK